MRMTVRQGSERGPAVTALAAGAYARTRRSELEQGGRRRPQRTGVPQQLEAAGFSLAFTGVSVAGEDASA